MDTVSYLTINGETREILDSQSRDDISTLQRQVETNTANIEYLAKKLKIDLESKTE